VSCIATIIPCPSLRSYWTHVTREHICVISGDAEPLEVIYVSKLHTLSEPRFRARLTERVADRLALLELI
jgi:hypothetical protein